jgi:hypothetical protein
MPKQIVSDIVYIDRINPITTAKIEEILAERFGEIIRWAIIECSEPKLKISITYLK